MSRDYDTPPMALCKCPAGQGAHARFGRGDRLAHTPECPWRQGFKNYDTPPETSTAKAAILRLPMRNARQAVELDDLYRSIVDLAARVHSDEAREHMSEALLALDKASQLLRVVKP